MRTLTLVLLCVSAGCVLDFPDETQDGVFACAVDADCIDGFVCSAGRCARLGAAEDAAVSSVDAEGSEAGAGVDVPRADLGLAEDARAADQGVVTPDASLQDALHDDGAIATPDATATRDAGGPIDSGAILDAGANTDAGPADVGCSETRCGALCVDLTADGAHCGTCNRSCGGGACSQGICQPATWYTSGSGMPLVLRYDADTDRLYWTNTVASGQIVYRPLNGGAPEVVSSGERNPQTLVLDDTNVYWSTFEQTSGPRPGHVRFRNKRRLDATRTVTPQTQSRPQGLAVQRRVVYWNSNSPLRIRAVETTSATPTIFEIAPSTGSSFVNAMLADDTRVYWFDAGGNVLAHPLDFRTPLPQEETIDRGAPEAKAVAQTNTHLYWGESANALGGAGRIYRIAKSGGARELVCQINPADTDESAAAMTVSATHLYFTSEDAGRRNGGVYRVLLGGGTPTRLADPSASDVELRGIAVAEPFVYYAEVDRGGRIMRVRLP